MNSSLKKEEFRDGNKSHSKCLEMHHDHSSILKMEQVWDDQEDIDTFDLWNCVLLLLTFFQQQSKFLE